MSELTPEKFDALPEAVKNLVKPLISRVKTIEGEVAGTIELAYWRGKQEAQLAECQKDCDHLVAEKTGICLRCGAKVKPPKARPNRERIAKRLWETQYPEGNAWETLKEDNSPTVEEYLDKADQIIALEEEK